MTSVRRSRLFQFAGIIIALLGLLGYWLNRNRVEPAIIDEGTAGVLGITLDENEKPLTFVVAGRDRAYTQLAGEVTYDENGRINGRTYNSRSNAYGTNTDTIFFVSIIGNDITLINIPRDIWLDEWVTKINSIYSYQGAEGLKNSVENVTGLSIDYYAIVNLDIFEGLVDALGGVEVNVPYPMNHTDYAGNLFINLDPGPQILDGEQAAGFVRYRGTGRGDYDRIDQVKTLAFAMLQRLKEMNVRATIKLPELTKTLLDDVETNADVALILDLLPRLNNFTIKSAATIPTELTTSTSYEGFQISTLSYNPKVISEFLASKYGGVAKKFTEAPEGNLLITNRSGLVDLGERYKEQLVAMGVSEDSIFVRDGSNDPAPTRVLAVSSHWQEADFYTSLFQTGKQQIDHLGFEQGEQMQLELILGEDAANTMIAKQAQNRVQSAVTQ